MEKAALAFADAAFECFETGSSQQPISNHSLFRKPSGATVTISLL
ncbi:hypothetical protein ABIA24_001131 [Sinorhizobium fredii]